MLNALDNYPCRILLLDSLHYEELKNQAGEYLPETIVMRHRWKWDRRHSPLTISDGTSSLGWRTA